MAHVIGDDCISCGSCEAECPVSAISEGDGKYEINADACIDCMCSTVPSRSNFRGIRFHTYKI